MQEDTLISLLRKYSVQAPDQILYRFLKNGEDPSHEITYQGFDVRVRSIAARLKHRCEKGDRVLIVYNSGVEYLSAFMACLYAGVVAVPVYPPRKNRKMARIQAIIEDAGAEVALTESGLYQSIEKQLKDEPVAGLLEWIPTDTWDNSQANMWSDPGIAPDTIAFLQYTSGSTGTPKGVMVSQSNIVHNLGLQHTGLLSLSPLRIVSWLPLYHDMGLIGKSLYTIAFKGEMTFMSPADFLQKPIRWLQAIDRYKANYSGAPNFAYDLLVSRITDEQVATLDLSTWKVALNGAEPIRQETMRRFVDKFAPAGFQESTVISGYGLAENTLSVSSIHEHTGIRSIKVRSEDLYNDKVVPVEEHEDGVALISCGKTTNGHSLLIAHKDTQEELTEDRVGEIWVGGPSVTQGYWQNPEKTAEVYGAYTSDTRKGPFFRTGDLGFIHHGNLYVTGRQKELIIIRGQNYYPQDIERVVQTAHPALKINSGAAFGVANTEGERLVIVQEVERVWVRKLAFEEVIGAVRRVVNSEFGLQVADLVLITPNSLPKTSSGKIQRRGCKDAYLDDELKIIAQLAKDNDKEKVQVPDAEQPVVMEVEHKAEIFKFLAESVNNYSGVRIDEISSGTSLESIGLDSVHAIAISGDLSEWLGRSLPPTLFYDYPTMGQLVSHLVGETPSQKPLKQALQAPIAIIGLACEFPGAEDATAFWEMLIAGKSGIGAPDELRTALTHDNPEVAFKQGGYLEGIDQFDAALFGIMPREAMQMDPQQRKLLHTVWRALEDAGIAPESLRGTETGVFVGASTSDYANNLYQSGHTNDHYYGTGNSNSILANRLSYLFDLHGPSMSIDTACSSSLVAIHQACQSLRHGESTLALAGGVNLILNEAVTEAFGRAGMLAKDGHCKTFDASADGYTRSEGAGVVILKPLQEAIDDNDQIYAVIKGTAINQDGKTNGLTAPNGPAQQAVVRKALKAAGLAPKEVGYVECHGTGTPLGDPIEANVLGGVLAEGREAHEPCYLGTVKANIGHLEAAAGIAGLIKATLAIQVGKVPGNPQLKTLNPEIKLDGELFKIPHTPVSWNGQSRHAGVSSFGFGGTNAHVVIGEAPAQTPHEPDQHPAELFCLAAHTESALAVLARQMMARYETSAVDQQQLKNLAGSLLNNRGVLPHRLAFSAKNAEEAVACLDGWLSKAPATPVYDRQNTGQKKGKIALMFSGQGAQYAGMGEELYRYAPEFKKVIDQCASLLEKEIDYPLKQLLFGGDDMDGALHKTAYTQPALFAIEYATGRQWMAWGVQPDCLIGHSVGEFAAACLAEVFTLNEAIKLVSARGRLGQQVPPKGIMMAIQADDVRVQHWIGQTTGQVGIAAYNGPSQTVVTGDKEAVRALAAVAEAQGVKCTRLEISNAFHSPVIAPMVTGFEQVAQSIQYQKPKIPVLSNLTGELAGENIMTAQYWVSHLIEPVSFYQGMQTAFRLGVNTFIEAGPKPTLTTVAKAFGPQDTTWLVSQQQTQPGWQTILHALAGLYVLGYPVDWEKIYPKSSYNFVKTPGLPFDTRSYWLGDTRQRKTGDLFSTVEGHPLIGHALQTASTSETVYHHQLRHEYPKFLYEHEVAGQPVYSAAAFIECFLAVGSERYPALRHLQILKPFIPEEGKQIQVIVRDLGNVQEALFYSKDGEQWHLHTRGQFGANTNTAINVTQSELVFLKIQKRISREVALETLWQKLADKGVNYGEELKNWRQIWEGEGEALGVMAVSNTMRQPVYRLHPAIVDAGLQLLPLVIPEVDNGKTYVLQATGEVVPTGATLSTVCWCHAIYVEETTGGYLVNLAFYTDEGVLIATVKEALLCEMTVNTSLSNQHDKHYHVHWQLKAGNYAPVLDLNPLTGQKTNTDEHRLLKDYQQQQDAMEHRVLLWVRNAMSAMGLALEVGQKVSFEGLLTSLNVYNGQRRLFYRCLQILAEASLIQEDGTQFTVVNEIRLSSAEKKRLDNADETQAGEPIQMAMVDRCGAALPRVLTEEGYDVLGLLFPADKSLPDASTVYQETPLAKVLNQKIEGLMQATVEAIPEGQSIRVLEIGAGTGSLTQALLQVFPAERTSYCFTDISNAFLAQAAQKFAECPFIEFRQLDIEESPIQLQFEPASYDIIIVANVLHATKDIGSSLLHIHQLLKPGGLLYMLECTQASPVLDMIFGLTDGWWRFEDNILRKNYPLLNPKQWENSLDKAGLSEFVCTQAVTEKGKPVGQMSIITAQKNKDLLVSSKKWIVISNNAASTAKVATALQPYGDEILQLTIPTLNNTKGATVNGSGNSEHWLSQLADQANPENEVFFVYDHTITGSEDSSTQLYTASQALSELYSQLTVHPIKKLHLVTFGAYPVNDGADSSSAVAVRPLWALNLTAALEGLCDTYSYDLEGENPDYQALVNQALDPFNENETLIRENGLFVKRLHKGLPDSQGQSWHVRPGACYLITGGTGGLGLLSAQWLVEMGATDLVLISRSGIKNDETSSEIGRLRAMGANIQIVQTDVSDKGSLGSELKRLHQALPIRGIIHTAGQGSASLLTQENETHYREAYTAKVEGAWALHEITKGWPLDFMLFYSSTTGLWGAKNLGAYAAANAALDALAAYRIAQGLPALTINWGTWDTGMLANISQQKLQAAGYRFLEHADIRLLGDAQKVANGQLMLADIDWAVFKNLYPIPHSRLFEEISVEVALTATGDQANSFSRQWNECPVETRQDFLLDYLSRLCEGLMRLPKGTLTTTESLQNYGLDSLVALEVKNTVLAQCGVAIDLRRMLQGATLQWLVSEILPNIPEAITTNPGNEPSDDNATAPTTETIDLLMDLEDMCEEEMDKLLKDLS